MYQFSTPPLKSPSSRNGGRNVSGRHPDADDGERGREDDEGDIGDV